MEEWIVSIMFRVIVKNGNELLETLTGCDPLATVVLNEDPGTGGQGKGAGRLAIRWIEFRQM